MSLARVIVDNLLEADVSRMLGAAFPMRRALRLFTAALQPFGHVRLDNRYQGEIRATNKGKTPPGDQGQFAFKVYFTPEVIERAKQAVKTAMTTKIWLDPEVLPYGDALTMCHLKLSAEKAVRDTATQNNIPIIALHVHESIYFQRDKEWAAQVTVDFKL